jgi:hypothetical protein
MQGRDARLILLHETSLIDVDVVFLFAVNLFLFVFINSNFPAGTKITTI